MSRERVMRAAFGFLGACLFVCLWHVYEDHLLLHRLITALTETSK